jgi:hypothetical protein
MPLNQLGLHWLELVRLPPALMASDPEELCGPLAQWDLRLSHLADNLLRSEHSPTTKKAPSFSLSATICLDSFSGVRSVLAGFFFSAPGVGEPLRLQQHPP